MFGREKNLIKGMCLGQVEGCVETENLINDVCPECMDTLPLHLRIYCWHEHKYKKQSFTGRLAEQTTFTETMIYSLMFGVIITQIIKTIIW